MITPEDIILAHAKQPYDPVKRRERYLRTRKLKGRRPAQQRPVVNKRPQKGALPPRTPGGSTAEQRRKALAQRRAAQRRKVTARVAKLTKKLIKLRAELQELVELAKLRSGVEPTDEPKASGTTKKAEPAGSKKQTSTKKQTAAEKKEAAERSKEYYEKNKKKAPSVDQRTKQLQEDITRTEQKIMRARRYLKTAAANARRDVDTNRPAATRRQTS